VIEHLTRKDGLGMLRECYRVLGSGGKIRIATPNLLKFVQLFQTGRRDDMRRRMDRKLKWHGWPSTASPECIILNFQLTIFGQRLVPSDPTTLRESLTATGFQAIVEFEPGVGDDAVLRDLETRHRVSIRDLNDYETMVFQAA
jgi:hypothetical protein